ncbi:hypothetical protein [Oricola nitratireducens]|uniref:hypothetical protein n=1 Tax=Oricola nitratireducens TaxID=2775868 RepID=UPI0018678890|nr:hypothetical protein [Oricola nitratireducens]
MTTAENDPSPPLSAPERETLECVVRNMIPASAEYGVPGADDPRILADILQSIDRDREALGKALRAIDGSADRRLANLPEPEQARRLAAFRVASPDLAAVIESVTARCYYRDDRVMASIGMEVRPPFPHGYEVEQGDWSLLEPVRARGRIYRDAG